MFSLWAVANEPDKKLFSKYKDSCDDVISWVYSRGVAFLGDAPAARASWAKALRAYEKHLAKEAIRAIVLPEVDLLMASSSMAQAQSGAGSYTALPDTRIWVYEVIQEVLKQASAGEAALLLDVISLNDLAHLEYNGNQMKARQGMEALVQHLQKWFFGRGENGDATQDAA